jgi:hypothetical protein
MPSTSLDGPRVKHIKDIPRSTKKKEFSFFGTHERFFPSLVKINKKNYFFSRVFVCKYELERDPLWQAWHNPKYSICYPNILHFFRKRNFFF